MSIDTRKLVAEIEEEVRRKRATGELPADLERELDNAFARYAPVGALDLDFAQVLEKVDETVVDMAAPVESSRPVVPYVKLAVRKATGWHVRYIANQLNSMIQGLSRAVRLLGDRVEALEASSPGFAGDRGMPPAPTDVDHWQELVVSELRGATGRVLHAECAKGALVAALVDAGVDAYGVEPDDDRALEASARSLDVRADQADTHLRLLDSGSLGGLVLSGCVDRQPVAAQATLADLATAKLAAGGRLIVLGTHPGAWGRGQSVVAADLSAGRPLHPETWVALLEQRGFGDVAVHDGPAAGELATVTGKGAEVINANFEWLNRVLFGPATYAVVATRPHS